MRQHLITLTVNGTTQRLEVASNELLLNVIREKLALTGAKYGCGIGECGACTVLVDGAPMLACLTLAVAVDGSNIVTIEGVSSKGGRLHPVQQAFIDQGAIQCGFCTPGMVVLAKALLDENPNPTEAEIREHMAGNLCRCTGYTSIIRAVQSSMQPQNGSNGSG